jgi:hypothetical protein
MRDEETYEAPKVETVNTDDHPSVNAVGIDQSDDV